VPEPGSLRHLVMELEIESGSRTFRIPAQEFVQEFEVESSTKSAYSGSITLFDEGDTLENLFLASGLNRKVKFRWNWSDLGLASAPLFVGSILRYTPTFMPQGIQFVLEIVPTSLLDAAVDKRVRSFPAGTLVSDIVLQIADERGWSTVDARGNPTVEPTGLSIDQPFSTTDESDVRFINEQLRPQAVNAAGVGGYRFFFDTFGAVHFHTKTFLTPRLRSYVFGRDSAGEVLSFTPTDTSALAMLAGGGNAVFRGQSSLNGAPVAKDAGATTGLEDQPDLVEESATASPDFGNTTHSSINVMTRDVGELERMAKDARERARDFYFMSELQVMGTHDVELFDYIGVTYFRRNGQPHYMSGRFRTLKIQHSYSAGGWITTFGGARDGLRPTEEGSLSRQNVVTISPGEDE
jgi:hypothetical protein